MNPKTDPNSAAFDYGLTKREYFAAMAMHTYMIDGHSKNSAFDNIAEASVKQADALIAALNKEVA